MIQRGLLSDGARLKAHLHSLGSRFALITDSTVLPLYGERLRETLCAEGLDVTLFSFPAGEINKTRATKEALEDQLFSKGLGRDCCLIALGGGVAGDLVGFLASTYCRGVSLVLIPTTLLAMIDASIGGKCGVNTPFGKNLVGTFFAPGETLVDPDVLKTLPQKELRGGAIEMVKHALVADEKLFEELEEGLEEFFALQQKSVDFFIGRNREIKEGIVREDPLERGKREILNFGHTVGHALEQQSHYTLSHGEAVAIGMLVEARLGLLTEGEVRRVEALIARCLPALKMPKLSREELFSLLLLDKKTRASKPRFVLLEKVGRAAGCHVVEEKLLKRVEDALCCY